MYLGDLEKFKFELKLPMFNILLDVYSMMCLNLVSFNTSSQCADVNIINTLLELPNFVHRLSISMR